MTPAAKKGVFFILAAVCAVTPQAWAQSGNAALDSTLTQQTRSITHWSGNLLFFRGHESASWDRSTFADPDLDTSKLVIPYSSLYDLFTLRTSFTTYGFENEWSISLGKLANGDDNLVLDLGIGGVFGSIPKTAVVNQVAPISYFSTLPGHPVAYGTATYTYSINGKYVAASVPLMLEWRRGMRPLSLNVRVGILYRIASVTAEHKFLAANFPSDYDIPSNEGRYTYFNDATITESVDHRISALIISAIPSVGLSVRLPFTNGKGEDSGYGLIIGADIGASTRIYLALSY